MINKRKTNYKPLLQIFVIFTICLLCGKMFFFKKTLFIVSSSSMESEYPVGTLVIAKNKPFESINAGDVIVYKSDALNGGLAFHRVVRITEDGVYTKGDSNDFEDNQRIVKENYVAKGVYKNYPLGRFITAVKTPLGFIVFLILPISALIIFYKAIELLIKNRRRLYKRVS